MPAFGDLERAADEMEPAEDLSHYFSETPPRKSLHVIVVLPRRKSSVNGESGFLIVF
jgi:hypothetical protein